MLLAFGGAAGASEICVKCSAPDASYACIVNGGNGSASDSGLNLYCISALAQSGSHQSCSIDRNSVAPCQGTRKELPAPAAFGTTEDADDAPDAATAPPPTAQPAAGAPPAKSETETGAKEPDKPVTQGPPKTVQEMVEKGAESAGKSVGDANKSAGDTMKKAGSAVGNAAKSTWKCLSSFFSDC